MRKLTDGSRQGQAVMPVGPTTKTAAGARSLAAGLGAQATEPVEVALHRPARGARSRACFAGLAAVALGGVWLSAQGSGIIQWQRSYEAPQGGTLRAIIAATDGGYLLGGYSDSPPGGDKTAPAFGGADYWVVKIDANGNKQWDRSYGGWYADELTAIVASSDGGYLLGGSSDSDATAPIGGVKTAPHRAEGAGRDYWVVKVDAQGNKQWDQSYGGTKSQSLSVIVSAPDGGFFLAGNSSSPVSGNKSAPKLGNFDMWLVKIDAQGNKIWDKSYGGSGDDDILAMLPTSEGGFLLAGFSYSPAGLTKSAPNYGWADFWIVKTDAGGSQQWDKSYGGTEEDIPLALVAAPDGGHLLAGYSESGPSGNKTALRWGHDPYYRDYWVVKVGADGAKEWDASYGGTESDGVYSALGTADGGFLLGGYSFSARDGNKTTAAFGSSDYWLVEIASAGDRQWDQAFGGSGYDVLYAMAPAPDGGYLLGGYSSSGNDGNKSVPNHHDGWGGFWIVKIAATIPPTITEQPQSVTATGGGSVRFSVSAFSFTQPIFYQWRLNGTDIPSATNATLTVTNVQPADAGRYTVLVRNEVGAVESQAAVLTYTDAAALVLSVHPSLTIYGTVGRTYRIERSDEPSGPLTWSFLAEVTLTNSPQLYVDTQAAVLPKRLYRVLLAQ